MKIFALCALAVAPLAYADVVTYNGSLGNLAASATFDFSGNNLTITLTNTATVAPTASNQALTGLFFNLTPNAVLTPVSATVAPGSAIIQPAECSTGNCAGATNVGGEFRYDAGGLGFLTGTDRGISSSGYIDGDTGNGNFNGANLDNPNSLDGANFAMVSSNFVPYSGNGGIDNDPLIRNSVVFVLSGVSGISEAGKAISNVYFTYGTSQPGEPSFPGCIAGTTNCGGGGGGGQVPEPGSLLLLGTAALFVTIKLRGHFA